jgi:hypothetical protein
MCDNRDEKQQIKLKKQTNNDIRVSETDFQMRISS